MHLVRYYGPIHPSRQVQVDPVRLAIAVPDSEVEIAVIIEIVQGHETDWILLEANCRR